MSEKRVNLKTLTSAYKAAINEIKELANIIADSDLAKFGSFGGDGARKWVNVLNDEAERMEKWLEKNVR